MSRYKPVPATRYQGELTPAAVAAAQAVLDKAAARILAERQGCKR